jgi:hypothetical protein
MPLIGEPAGVSNNTVMQVLKKLKAMNINGGFVVVHIWRPRQGDKCRTSVRALTGGLAGHVSLSIFKPDGTSSYASFWPSISGKKANGSIGMMKSYAEDCAGEGGRPADASIPFFTLDIQKIEAAFNALNCQCKKDEIKWVAQVVENVSITSEKQNCATLVWTILKAGGIERYNPQLKGPSDKALRKKYKCDEGSLLWGLFDNASWRKSLVSPVLLLHLTASAREKESKASDTDSLEDMVLEIFRPHVDNSKAIISMDELESEHKKLNKGDIAQMLIPFAFFGNKTQKSGFQTRRTTAQSTSNANNHTSPHSEALMKNQFRRFSGVRTLFPSPSFSKHVVNAISTLRRMMR